MCPSCEHGQLASFYESSSVPVNSCILLASRTEAITYPRGDIELGFCGQCGFISNMRFDVERTEYSARYEETQGYSDTFNVFHKALAERLITRYDLRKKDLIEIGCGKGEFLVLLCELGNNRGVGFDPGFDQERVTSSSASHIRFIKDFYSERYVEYEGDFVCCKMTLEHIHSTAAFVRTVRQSIGDKRDTIVFFQVPDATRILRDHAFEDIYYEHCSYFTPGSIGRLFRACGFDVLDIRVEYDEQYLTIEARPGEMSGSEVAGLDTETDLRQLQHLISEFSAQFKRKTEVWEKRLAKLDDASQKVVLWGSGSKAVSFLTTLELPRSLQYVVDINPHRQGYFMPGTGQKIVPPEFLQEYMPDVVVAMNRVYTEEIRATLSRMNVHAELMAL